MATLLLAVGLIACSDSSCASGCDERGSGQEDTAAMVYSTDEPPPLWTLDEVGQLVADLIAMGAPNPVDIGQSFSRVMAEGDEDCPGDPYRLSVNGGCTTDSGARYSGIGWLYVMDRTDVGGELVPSSWYHGGDFEIVRATGERFAGGGDLEYSTSGEVEEQLSEFTVAGSWVDEAQPGWFAEGFSGVYTGELLRSVQGTSLTINGGIGVGDRDLNFVNLQWSTLGDCDGAAVGTLQLREPEGYWYSWDLGDDCDACGALTFHQDQDLGELCLDLTAWGQTMTELSSPR